MSSFTISLSWRTESDPPEGELVYSSPNEVPLYKEGPVFTLTVESLPITELIMDRLRYQRITVCLRFTIWRQCSD